MKFSIIVPVYNAADFLETTVNSVLAQSMVHWEMLLSEDGSTDGVTPALCDRIAAEDERIQVLHKPNGGAGDARNYAIDKAQGDYIVFLDSDDQLEPDALQTLETQLRKSPTDVCIFGYRMILNGQEIPTVPAEHPYCEPFTLAQVPQLLLSSPAAWCAVWKRSLFESTDIRFRPRGWGEDLAMTRKMLTQASSIVLIPDLLYRYVIREGSVTTRRNLDTNAEIIDTMEDVLNWFRAAGLFDAYRDELCCLCLNNMYDACVRIIKADPSHPLPDTLLHYAAAEFPDYRETAYVRAWPAKRKLILSLLEKHHYKTAQAIFKIM